MVKGVEGNHSHGFSVTAIEDSLGRGWFLDAPLARLLYFNQRHAHPRRQHELFESPADSLDANYGLQYARGKRGLTNQIQ
ncbi:MAG: hypothetical protein ABSF70_15170 [Terracidiphilus sp.]